MVDVYGSSAVLWLVRSVKSPIYLSEALISVPIVILDCAPWVISRKPVLREPSITHISVLRSISKYR